MKKNRRLSKYYVYSGLLLMIVLMLLFNRKPTQMLAKVPAQIEVGQAHPRLFFNAGETRGLIRQSGHQSPIDLGTDFSLCRSRSRDDTASRCAGGWRYGNLS